MFSDISRHVSVLYGRRMKKYKGIFLLGKFENKLSLCCILYVLVLKIQKYRLFTSIPLLFIQCILLSLHMTMKQRLVCYGFYHLTDPRECRLSHCYNFGYFVNNH
jgi:ascorbate-specific PTS system EIIC-type component UlaA